MHPMQSDPTCLRSPSVRGGAGVLPSIPVSWVRSGGQVLGWVLGVLMAWSAHCGQGSATRSGPALYSANEVLTTTIVLAPLASVSVQTLTETLPVGWTLVSAEAGGTYDINTRTVRWLFFDSLVREIHLQLQAPASPGATASFSGEAAFDGETVGVAGLTQAALRPPPSGTVSRSLPATYRPGIALTVTVTVTPETGVETYGVTDTFPAGWTASDPSHFGSVQSGQVRWGPFLDETTRTLTYTLTPPADATETGTLSGSASFDSTSVSTTGSASITKKPDASGTTSRALPASYHSAEAFTVTLTVTPEAAVGAYAVVETPPAGWTVETISHFGNVQGGQVRWGPFLDADERTLTYSVSPPAGVGTTATFGGAGEFDGTTVTVTGATQVAWASLENGTLVRSMAATCQREVPLSVTLHAAPNDQVSVYGVEEFLPAGWTVGEIGLASYQASSHSLRWGPFLDNLTRDLVYELVAPADATGSVTLSGQGTFGAVEVQATGDVSLAVELPTGGGATRTVASMFQPGQSVPVTLHVAPQEGVGLYVVEEYLPEGWTASGASAGGEFDTGTRRVRWGPFADHTTRDLSYQLVTPSGARGTYRVVGTAYFDGNAVTIGGQSNLLANAAPELSSVPALDTFEDGPVVITFNATDDLTADADLVVTASSSNPGFLPNGNLTLGRIGGARSLRMSLPAETAGQSTITVTVNDGAYQTESSFVLTISLTNDVPVLTVPAGTSLAEDGSVDLHGFSIADPDVGAGAMQLRVRLTNGVVNFPGLGGATVVSGAMGTSNVVLQGTVGELNTALATVRVSPDADYHGTLPVWLVVDDRGNTGPDGAQKTTNGVTLIVTPVNDPPEAGALTVLARPGRTLKVHASKVLEVASDADRDAIEVSGVSATSANGAKVSMQAQWIYYEPRAGTTLPDTITYTLSDGNVTVEGTVTVIDVGINNDPSNNRLSLRVVGEDTVMEFLGIPNRAYRIQATADPGAGWSDIGTVTADRYGRLQFTEIGGAAYPTRYYRTYYP
jgi:hypothetical protein